MRCVKNSGPAGIVFVCVLLFVCRANGAEAWKDPGEFFHSMDMLLTETEKTAAPEEIVALPFLDLRAPDGFLGEVIEKGVQLDDFMLYPEGGAPDYRARAYLAFDDRNIYVAKAMEKSEDYELRARTYDVPDANIWTDDNVEIFLDPFLSGQEYFQIIANPLGEVWDSRWVLRRQSDPRAADARELITVRQGYDDWSSGAETEVERGDDYWKIGVRVPFGAFGLQRAPEAGIWGANFCHSNRHNDQLSQWKVTPEGFHQPRGFGAVSFGVQATAVDVEWNVARAGYMDNRAEIMFYNPGSRMRAEAVIRVETAKGGVIEEVRYRGMIDEGESKAVIPFKIPPGAGGEYVVAGRVEGEGVAASFRRIVHLGEPLEIHLKRELVYKDDRMAEGSLALHLGGKTLEETELVFRIINGQKTIGTRVPSMEGNIINFGINAGLLSEGDSILEVEAVIGGRSMITRRAHFTVLQPPFGF